MRINSDYLVLGSGLAGLLYALRMAEHGTVSILAKSDPGESNTAYAQGGIAGVFSPTDSFDAHIADTLSCGAGLCHEDIVRIVITKAPDVIKDLTDFGAKFDRNTTSEESYELGQEGGHSARRILHAGDATGAEIIRALMDQALNHPNIKLYPHHIAIDLVTYQDPERGPSVAGCYALNRTTGEIGSFQAKVTLLATGGVGKVYLYTSNPDSATGDGIAMAYRAGATIANMEFIQFHPTCLYHPSAKSFLLTEALRGEGAVLRTISGHRFMSDYDSRGELAPRDIVARAIDETMKRTGDDNVLLDVSHLDADFIKTRFPMIYAKTKEFGFDLTTGPVPVVPAAHYCCGGVKIDEWAQTELSRLLCAGESSWTGLHGANRLASNSLLEAAVFAERASQYSIGSLPHLSLPPEIPDWDYVGSVKSPEAVYVSYTWDEVRRLMWNLVGIVRSDKRLDGAKKRLELIKEEVREYYWKYRVTADLIELRNIINIAELIIACARSRQESRGLHSNVDYPEKNDNQFRKDTFVRRAL